MSGGYFQYEDRHLKYQIFPHDKLTNELEDREISEIVWDVLELLHEFDYYKKGDSDEEDYIKAKNEFKKKWFEDDRSIRCKRYIDDMKKELYATFGITDEPCEKQEEVT